ncbi:MAG: glycogen debranching protein GlgX [Deltaproteobacteria bacterium]|jgi:glycogen operon protein|nr:glycogen debranching protein GlgX [Deltaproteobacteria bacterium]
MKQACSKLTIRRGRPLPFGATPLADGVNFAVFSRHATAVSLVLFHPLEKRPCAEFALDSDRHRTGDVWHIFVEGLLPGFAYGYKVDGLSRSTDPRHRYTAVHTLLDPYARSLTGPSLWRGSSREEAQTGGWLGLLPDESFDWQKDRPPRHHLADLVIYEMHVRGFTRDSSSEVMRPGTFHGVIEKIPYLHELGVNAVELLPVTEFDEADNYRKNPLTGEPLHNFWGYHPLSFFAAKRAYSSDPEPGGEMREFKTMVKALHAAGIEVILDMVFNHTGEGDERGRTLSFRGLDNAVYYLVDEHGTYANYSGCGNTVNCNHPVVRDLIIDSLCYWVTEMHIDGFRFDLASILGRGPSGEVLANPPLIERIAANPVLADVKLIAEAWDAAGLYQVGTFPNFGRWAEWNGQFRDDLRRFVRGDSGMAPRLATRLAGSSDLYQTDGRAPFHSINFVTCHDGFTLADLVSYDRKHNEANGEFNADGCDDNFSANHGVEGPSNDPAILALRRRQSFNYLTLLLMAHGVPMLLAGDEMGRTQHGNNNSWCQDNLVGWVNWDDLKRNPDLFVLVKNLIALRTRHPMLRPRQFEGAEVDGRRLIWHGRQPEVPDWSEESRHVGMSLQDLNAEAEIYLFANAHPEALQVELPRLPKTRCWGRFVDTSLPAASVSCQPGQEPRLKDQRTYSVSGRSVIVLVSKS